jgi:hypothetical protein
VREEFNFAGTPIRFSFRDEKQIKANKARVAEGKEPVTKKSKAAKEELRLKQLRNPTPEQE